jgi:hypothetical protein
MRALREQPRLVAAKLGISFATLIVALVVGSALAGDGSDAAPDLRTRLERSEQLRRDQALEFDRRTAEIGRLRRDLRAAARQMRARTRAGQRLRGELRAARLSLARQTNP